MRYRWFTGLIALLIATPAVAGEGPPAASWRDANDAVGKYRRGHIDILRAEEALTPPTAPEPATAASVLDAGAALRRALLARPDLMAVPGMSEPELQQLRVEVAELRHAVQRAWTEAVLAQGQLRRQRDVQEAADVGLELARRMAQVGNWSQARAMEQELAAWRARAQTVEAEQFAATAREALVRLVGGDADWRVPDSLPAPPALETLPETRTPVAALEEQALRNHPRWPLLEQEARWREQALGTAELRAWRQSVESLVDAALQAAETTASVPLPQLDPRRQSFTHALERAVLGRAEADALARTLRSQVREAHRRLLASHALAAQSAREVERLATAVQEETLLRYNGMFVGTWDLLASAQSRLLSEMATARARRDFWLAHAALRALLAGAPHVSSGPATAAGAAEAQSARPH